MAERLALHAQTRADDPIGDLIQNIDDKRSPHVAGQGLRRHGAKPATGHAIDLSAPTDSPITGDPSLPHVVIVDKTMHKTHLFEQDPATGKPKEIFSTPDATGKGDGWTPVGRYTVVERHLHPTYTPTHGGATVAAGPDNPLGPAKVRLADSSGHWTNIEMHGTNNDNSIGNNASHGCVRHHNRAIAQMYPFLRIGTPVYITNKYDPAQLIRSTDFSK
jgi:lipoprotein-anchoring transpeptidase ErfK/SrfK